MLSQPLYDIVALIECFSIDKKAGDLIDPAYSKQHLVILIVFANVSIFNVCSSLIFDFTEHFLAIGAAVKFVKFQIHSINLTTYSLSIQLPHY